MLPGFKAYGDENARCTDSVLRNHKAIWHTTYHTKVLILIQRLQSRSGEGQVSVDPSCDYIHHFLGFRIGQETRSQRSCKPTKTTHACPLGTFDLDMIFTCEG